MASQLAKPGSPRFERVHEGAGPGIDCLEHEEEQACENKRSGDGVQHELVDLARQPVHHRFEQDCLVGNAARFALQGTQLGICGADRAVASGAAGLPVGGLPIETGKQIGAPGGAGGPRGDDGDAELGLQAFDIDLEPVAFGQVDHVEHDDHRPSNGAHLQDGV